MKIETKYSIGDEVWLMEVKADKDGMDVTYYLEDREIDVWIEEEELFETKKGVIESLWDKGE